MEEIGNYSDREEVMAPFGSLNFNINDEYIYLSGISNYDIYNGGLSNQPTEIHFVKLNRGLEPIYEKFYKGDVCYYNNFMKQTNDEGFIFLTTRYDYTTQDNERDIYILKVDSEGNLPVSSKELRFQACELLVFPNPGNKLKIRTAIQSTDGIFNLYNLQGKQVFSKKINRQRPWRA